MAYIFNCPAKKTIYYMQLKLIMFKQNAFSSQNLFPLLHSIEISVTAIPRIVQVLNIESSSIPLSPVLPKFSLKSLSIWIMINYSSIPSLPIPLLLTSSPQLFQSSRLYVLMTVFSLFNPA